MDRTYKIEEFLIRIKRPIEIIPTRDYKLVTIKMNHKGVVLRGEKKGALIKSKMYEVKKGDFILSGIDSRNGAFGIVPEELDGAIVTNDFWYFKIDENIISKRLFLELTSTTWFDEICKRGSDGTTQRIRLQKDKFFIQKIFLPKEFEQENLLQKLLSFKEKQTKLASEINQQKSLLNQLKQSILQEAIQGKLTREWREENPELITGKNSAVALLKHIKVEKAQRKKEKKDKKEKSLPHITLDEIPFELPKEWVWCRLGDILNLLSDYHANGSYKILKKNVELYDEPNFAIMLRTTNFHKKNRIKYKYISEHAYNFLSKSKVYPGDIIMNKIADPGRVFYVEDLDKPMSLAMNLFLIRINDLCNNKFLYNYLNLSYKYIYSFTGGATTKTITKDAVKELLFPLPSILEQKTIVEKIEALMEKCSAMEQQITQSESYAEMLMQAVLKEAFEKKPQKHELIKS